MMMIPCGVLIALYLVLVAVMSRSLLLSSLLLYTFILFRFISLQFLQHEHLQELLYFCLLPSS